MKKNPSAIPLSGLLPYEHARDKDHILQAFTGKEGKLLYKPEKDSTKYYVTKEVKGWTSTSVEQVEVKDSKERTALHIRYTLAAKILRIDLPNTNVAAITDVAYDKNSFVGFITYFKQDNKEARLLYLYVHPNFRRKGFGQKLMQNAQHDSFAHGAQKFCVSVSADNKQAPGFFTKIGFKGTQGCLVFERPQNWKNPITTAPSAQEFLTPSDQV